MAHLSKTRAIIGFTSPRTFEKTIPEIRLLIDEFSGKKWDTDSQAEFFEKLFASPFYDAEKRPKNPAWAARDRINRAPKSLGFVDIEPVIKLTKVGGLLLSGVRTNEILTRQLMKFQLPSPYHTVPTDSDFNVRPYLELLRMVKELGVISKTEIAIFFLQLLNYEHFDEVKNKIIDYRAKYKAYAGNKKQFSSQIFDKELTKLYAEQIEKKQFKGRQDNNDTLKGLLKTKRGLHTDYADAISRYIRSTQLISFDKNFRLIISEARSAEVDYLLNTIPRDAISFNNKNDFKSYLFEPFNIKLLSDDKEKLEIRLSELSVSYSKKDSIENLKNLLEVAEAKKISEVTKSEEAKLKGYKEFSDIIDIFDKIHKKDIPDPSLYLEWNVWRAMVMMNYAKRVQGNFRLDLDGLPLTTAGAKLPDIEIDYEGFKVIIEVTMSSGQKQYDMEGEPVPRHFGVANKSTTEPVYCIFIAPKISEGTLGHYFALNTRAPKVYWKNDTSLERRTNIIPMSIEHFRSFITTAKNSGFNNPKNLKSYLDSVLAESRKLDDEEVWLNSIQKSVKAWV